MVFPNDPVAHINAANAAMIAGDMERAARHLDKAGDAPEANYARGIYAGMNDNFEQAALMFQAALDAGYEAAAPQLEMVNTIISQMAEAAAAE